MSDHRICILCGALISLDDRNLKLVTNGPRKTVLLNGVVRVLATKATTARRLKEAQPQPEPEVIAANPEPPPAPTPPAVAPAPEEIREQWTEQAQEEVTPEPRIPEAWKAALQKHRSEKWGNN